MMQRRIEVSAVFRQFAAIAIVAAFACLALPAPSHAQASVRLQSQSVRVLRDRIEVEYCHGFGCFAVTAVPFKDAEIAELTQIMQAGAGSAAEEREAVKQAVAYFERHAAKFAGTGTDIAGNYTLGGDTSQLDCVDEARNSTRLLILLEKKGLLRYHRVAKIEGRGNFIDTRYPHNTAVLQEKATGVKWSVDSWMRHNGDIPEVMTLKRWFKEGYS
ncbi:MAG: hypothetical protein H6884_01925 [Rhodobiaceae bacterium]|nr:hypothetical protein [Rhodobiaceae bacterium]